MKFKSILIAAIFAVGSAQADVIATLQNKAGGLIYLTDVKTKGCKDGRAVFSTNSGGSSIWGCWFLDDVVVHIKWDDNGTSAFPAGSFTMVKKDKGNDL